MPEICESDHFFQSVTAQGFMSSNGCAALYCPGEHVALLSVCVIAGACMVGGMVNG